MSSANSGVSSLTADSCAGCHRAHTADGPFLLTAPSEEELCLSCHGDAVAGATTDVVSGVQYALGSTGLRDTAELGALRGGGFETTRIGDPFRYNVGTARYSKVQVSDTGADVTSAHLDLTGTLGQAGKAWGNGANGSGAGPAATIGCASCHNPHGNGQYRILNPIPEGTGINAAWVIDVYDYGVVAASTYRTTTSANLLVGDTVTVAGNTLAGANVANAVVASIGTNGTTFTLTGVVAAGTGTGGTVTRVGGVRVTDAAAPPAGDERNYTVIQTPTSAGYTLLASEAAAYDPTDGDYFHYRVPWNGASGTTNLDAPNGIPGGTVGAGGFGEQITAWCTSCHTRYWAWQNPTEATGDEPATGAAYSNARPGDPIFEYQHRTRGASGRGCLTCHVSHGTSAVMDGTFSSIVPFPDGSVDTGNSRLLKVGNRGTCQLCHDPTGTAKDGDQYPPAPYPIPGTP